jgi:hypothetical protein
MKNTTLAKLVYPFAGIIFFMGGFVAHRIGNQFVIECQTHRLFQCVKVTGDFYQCRKEFAPTFWERLF